MPASSPSLSAGGSALPSLLTGVSRARDLCWDTLTRRAALALAVCRVSQRHLPWRGIATFDIAAVGVSSDVMRDVLRFDRDKRRAAIAMALSRASTRAPGDAPGPDAPTAHVTLRHVICL